MPEISVVVPAYNEEAAIGGVLKRLRAVLGEAGIAHEIVVVIDGATDGSAAAATPLADQVIEHPQNLGYGRSLKTGILAATNDLIAITDADGTYPAERLPELIRLADRYHMVVAARTGAFYRGGFVKRMGRVVFRYLSEFAAGQRIPDINSGFRVFRRSHVIPFFPLLSTGFSFTTTLTLVYLLNDFFVHYVPIEYHERIGRSKVHHLRDAARALQIIVEAILRCNPIKIFLLLAMPFLAAGAVFAGLAVAIGNWVCGLISAVTLSTTGLIMGLGFLAVSVMPRRDLFGPASPVRSATSERRSDADR
jgi:glycosyltransferase involved in cell wall biosynthesis